MGGTYVRIYIYLCWFFGVAGVIDVLMQPRRAFRAAGHSKLRWLLIEVVGVVVVGIFTWAFYAIKIRPSVVRAGGRPPRKWLRSFAGNVGSSSTTSTASRRTEPPPGSGSFQPKSLKRIPCSPCGGVGRTTCHLCGNTGQIRNPHNQSPALMNCNACGGPPGGVTCLTCRGKGYTEEFS